MAEEEVSLFGASNSPLSKRVEMALKLKGVEYEYFEEDMHKPSRWVCRQNPVFQSVPVLLHDEDSIVDPIIILEYIDETWKHNPLLFPPDPKGRAKTRFLIKVIDEKCTPALLAACWGRGMAQDRATQDAHAMLQILEDELKDKKFFGGENIGAVDLVASFLALWLGVIEEINGVKLLRPEKFPMLNRWIGEFLSSSVVKDSLPPRDQLLDYHRTMANNQNPFPPGNPPMAGGPLPFPPMAGGGPLPFPPMAGGPFPFPPM